MTSRRVAACVVTGFLGSGKTTLLRSLLAREPGRDRIAVVVNEVGEVGIDGRVLSGFEFAENVVELASGCICCSIDEYRFDLAVDELLRRVDPTLLVLETTGVADPAPTIERLERCGVGVDAVVTVVDATAWRIAMGISRTARRQVEAADFLVVSKADLVPATVLRALRRRLRAWNPRALVLVANPRAPFEGADLLLATTAARLRTDAAAPAGDSAAKGAAARQPADAGARPGGRGERSQPGDAQADAEQAAGHLAGDRIESFAWSTASPVDREALSRVLEALPPCVLRAKGLLGAGEGQLGYLFHVVCGRVDWSGFPPASSLREGAQAVFLGPGVLAEREAVVAALEGCVLGAGRATA